MNRSMIRSSLLTGRWYRSMKAGFFNGPVAGYVPGGAINGAPYETAKVDKFLFADDTRTTLATGLAAIASSNGAYANSGVAGYVFRYNATDKFVFPSDTRSTLAATPSTNDSSNNCFANSGVAGYVAGGGYWNGSTTVRNANIDKYAFADDSRTTIATTLSANISDGAGFADSGVAGYSAGGNNGALITTVDKIAFPGDTRTTLATGLSVAVQNCSGFARSGVAGYVAGGGRAGDFAMQNHIDKFAFPSDTRTTLTATLSVARRGLGTFSNNRVAGYFAGGNVDIVGVGLQTVVDKLAFATETRTVLATGLSAATGFMPGMANSGDL